MFLLFLYDIFICIQYSHKCIYISITPFLDDPGVHLTPEQEQMVSSGGVIDIGNSNREIPLGLSFMGQERDQ